MTRYLPQQFTELSELLLATQTYWRSMAYYQEYLPWVDQHPDLVRYLMSLPQERIEQLARDERALTAALAHYLPFTRALRTSATVASLPQRATRPVSPHFYAGIPGRKWRQVEAFARCIPVSAPVLEWCAGKSHLGFYLQHCSGQAVTALEWNETLVAQANARAAKDGVPLQSFQVNVLSQAAEHHLCAAGHVVALHACGELHERLLQLSVQRGAAQVHISPCCYHKRAQDQYQPMSAQGRGANLTFSKQELHTAVMGTVTAGAGAQRQRQQLQVMRLGFDELQRDVRGVVDYLPLPSLPAQWARADFATFCRYCAELKDISLPAAVDWPHYQQRGEQRFRQVAALDLVRFLFRRPIEVWLALDRILLLYEHGYQVQLGTFCPPSVTPRNLLLQAWRH